MSASPAVGAAARRRRTGSRAAVSAAAFTGAWLAVIAAAFAVRFWDLARAPVWMDEAFTYMAAQLPLRTILFGQIDNHPPLFYALQHLWYGVDPGLEAVRVPAALAGGLAVVVTALAAADLVGRRAGLFAGAFLALSTAHIYFSQDARMYPLLTLGLAAAVWGLAGLVQRPGRRLRYGGLYVLGGVVAVYAQAVSLIFLAALNLALLVVLAARRTRWRGFVPILAANLALGLLSLPWLLSLTSAMGAFQGLRRYGLGAAAWFYATAVGFPGAPEALKKPALLLLAALLAWGAGRGWRSGRGAFVAAGLGGLVLYPLGLVAANVATPILEHRVFLPCAVAAALLFGLAAAEIERPALRYPVLAAWLALALVSLTTEHRLRVKPEDDPQALALADRAGFAGAPILTCGFFPGATAHLSAPARPVFFMTPQGPVRMDARFPQALGMSIYRLRAAGAPQFAAYLGPAADVAANAARLRAADRVVVLSAVCDSEAPDAFLRRLGFARQAAPPLAQPRRVIFSTVWTQLELWRRVRP